MQPIKEVAVTNHVLIAMILMSSVLAGCSAFPHSKEKLMERGTSSAEYCIAKRKPQVEDRVQGYLNHCYHSLFITLNTGGFISQAMILNVMHGPETSELVLHGPTVYGDQYYFEVNLSEGHPGCQTTMRVVAGSWAFTESFEKLFEVAQGEDPWCAL